MNALWIKLIFSGLLGFVLGMVSLLFWFGKGKADDAHDMAIMRDALVKVRQWHITNFILVNKLGFPYKAVKDALELD